MQVALSHGAIAPLLPSYVPGIHAIRSGHVIRPGAMVPEIRGNRPEDTLWVGGYTTVQGGIRHAGSIVLARGCTTWNSVRGGLQVTVGAGCVIDGDVECDGNVVVQAGAEIRGRVRAGNDVHLLGACTVGDVECRGDVFIDGTPTTGTLSPKGRIQTRSWTA